MDFAYVAAELAFASGEANDAEFARKLLASCGPSVGAFERRRLAYLNRLAVDSVATAASPEPTFVENLPTRYLRIEPSFAGIGIRLQAVIADAIAAHRSKEPRSQSSVGLTTRASVAVQTASPS